MAIRLLANENFPHKSVLFLKSQGYNVLSIGTDYAGISDAEVMEIAIEEQRLILTFDRDYGELIFNKEYRPKQGVVYLRLEDYESDYPGKLVNSIIREHSFDFSNALTVIDKHGIRQRKYR